jgi:ABC-2 type transport system ATP-binding protein
MQQRLAVGISLVHSPKVLVLDEPTLGVDVENVLQIVETLTQLSKEGITVVLTSHQMDLVEMLADRIALLVSGKLVALETRAEFLGKIDRNSCILNLLENLDSARLEKVLALGATHEDLRIRFSSNLLYEVMDVLRPLNVGSLSCGDEDFTQVFLKRVREYENA